MTRTFTDKTVLLGHGSGGQMMKRIIDEIFLDAFGSPEPWPKRTVLSVKVRVMSNSPNQS